MRSPLLPLVLGISFACGSLACSGVDGASIASERAGTTPIPASPQPGDPQAPVPVAADGGTGDGGSDGSSAAPATGPWPGSQVILLPFAAQKAASGADWGVALTDIIRHLHPTYGTQYDYPTDRITWGHEVTHGINSHLRNYLNVTGKKANGFYLMQDRFALVVEPNVLLSNVATYVPASLRGSRYQTYLVDQVSGWNDMPTYVFDEWVAYTNGSEVGVELATTGSWTTSRDGVAGTLEFTIYALALGRAVEALDPTYFKSYAQFRELLAWNAERAMSLYRRGAVLPLFASASQDAYHAAWKTSPDARELRNFARRTFGGAYCTKVLEISPSIE